MELGAKKINPFLTPEDSKNDKTPLFSQEVLKKWCPGLESIEAILREIRFITSCNGLPKPN